MLKIGDAAPDFSLPNQDGVVRSLADARGKTVVLYFYPKDLTPGCTTEACDVRDAILHRQLPTDAIVYGVSADSPKMHQKFRAKHGLNFDLLSDPERTVIQAYGSWVEKRMMGREYMGIDRSTFVIGPDGTLLQVHRSVKSTGHIPSVVASLGRGG